MTKSSFLMFQFSKEYNCNQLIRNKLVKSPLLFFKSFVNVISYKLMNIFTQIFHCIRIFLHKKLLSQQRIQKKEKLYVISLIHCNEKKRHLGKDISFQNIMRLDSNLKYQCNISAWRIKSFVCAKAVKSNFLYLFFLFIDRQIIQRYNQSSPNSSG